MGVRDRADEGLKVAPRMAQVLRRLASYISASARISADSTSSSGCHRVNPIDHAAGATTATCCAIARSVIVGPGQHDDELVAPLPHQQVTRPQPALPCAGHVDEEGIAGGVTVPVVVLLEAVEVEDADRDAQARTPRRRHDRWGHHLQSAAIQRAGERVVEGGLAKPLGED